MSEENRIYNEQEAQTNEANSGLMPEDEAVKPEETQQPSWQAQSSQETHQETSGQSRSFYDESEPIWKSMDMDGLDRASDVYSGTGSGSTGSTYGNGGANVDGTTGNESAGNGYGSTYGNGAAGSSYGNTYGNSSAGNGYGNTYGNSSAGNGYGNTYGNGSAGNSNGSTYGSSSAGANGSYGGGSYGNGGYNGGSNGSTDGNGSGKKKGHGLQIAIVCILAVVIMAAACIYAIEKYGSSAEQTASNDTTTSGKTESSGSDVTIDTTDTTENQVNLTVSDTEDTSSGVFITDVSDVVEEVMPAIVAITSTTIVESGSYGPFSSGTYEAVGAGSGIIIGQTDTELLIVTNNHVVSDATSLEVQFIDESSVTAYTKATSSDNDIAVVSVLLSDMDEDTLDAIKIATLGNSDDLRVGEGIIAIGNALGYGQSVTVGVVSALNREVTTDEGTTQVMIQLDAAINGGNSGGALLNKYGEVVGINSAKYSSSDSSSASIEGMGFAIPISDVIDVIEELMNTETRYKVADDERGYLGVSGGDITEQMNLYFGYPMGFYIQSVVEGGAAEEAGIQAGDIIVGFAGTEITSYSELSELMQYYAVGETVTVTVARANDNGEFEEIDIEVTLCENLAE